MGADPGHGNGLQSTLLGLRGGLEDMTEQSIGFVMSAFFVGYAAGSVYAPRLVQSVGHVRTFAAFASMASAIALACAIFATVEAWALLRTVNGFCFAGLILVVESWLNAGTPSRPRDCVLAIYGVVTMAAIGASQFLITIANPAGFLLFCTVSILLSLSLAPVTLSTTRAPAAMWTEVNSTSRWLADVANEKAPVVHGGAPSNAALCSLTM